MGTEKQRAHSSVVRRISTSRPAAICVRRPLRRRGRQQSARRLHGCADDRGYLQRNLQRTGNDHAPATRTRARSATRRAGRRGRRVRLDTRITRIGTNLATLIQSAWVNPCEFVKFVFYAAAVSFGNSIVPLNFGGSSSIPKLSQ